MPIFCPRSMFSVALDCTRDTYNYLFVMKNVCLSIVSGKSVLTKISLKRHPVKKGWPIGWPFFCLFARVLRGCNHHCDAAVLGAALGGLVTGYGIFFS
ncbi:hypothetical protein C4A57_02102 [Escherichia coli]|nr:hypothetical protein C4A62_01900 [Escherichia coli]RDP26638.1 hypothetical protein C4A57_02102 [Escherichia coli]